MSYPIPSANASWRDDGRRRASIKRLGVDHYALLGLEARRWAASPKELRDGEGRAFGSLETRVWFFKTACVTLEALAPSLLWAEIQGMPVRLYRTHHTSSPAEFLTPPPPAASSTWNDLQPMLRCASSTFCDQVMVQLLRRTGANDRKGTDASRWCKRLMRWV